MNADQPLWVVTAKRESDPKTWVIAVFDDWDNAHMFATIADDAQAEIHHDIVEARSDKDEDWCIGYLDALTMGCL